MLLLSKNCVYDRSGCLPLLQSTDVSVHELNGPDDSGGNEVVGGDEMKPFKILSEAHTLWRKMIRIRVYNSLRFNELNALEVKLILFLILLIRETTPSQSMFGDLIIWTIPVISTFIIQNKLQWKHC